MLHLNQSRIVFTVHRILFVCLFSVLCVSDAEEGGFWIPFSNPGRRVMTQLVIGLDTVNRAGLKILVNFKAEAILGHISALLYWALKENHKYTMLYFSAVIGPRLASHQSRLCFSSQRLFPYLLHFSVLHCSSNELMTRANICGKRINDYISIDSYIAGGSKSDMSNGQQSRLMPPYHSHRSIAAAHLHRSSQEAGPNLCVIDLRLEFLFTILQHPF
ncbi:hypothetical protein L1987_25164 [Smallanthus sonchifolius]|uniref:Uncharacterized protein n=1 Tax=Smallanthus sonchifolius TaxID=185202 RepID=A0ACB9IMN4_9ASTR|nr:hypothetical protein L1987_25164 [Smallanthus sonchifolius]